MNHRTLSALTLAVVSACYGRYFTLFDKVCHPLKVISTNKLKSLLVLGTMTNHVPLAVNDFFFYSTFPKAHSITS